MRKSGNRVNRTTLFESLDMVVKVVWVPDVELVVVTADVWLALLAADRRSGADIDG